jgi:hypothetical protein
MEGLMMNNRPAEEKKHHRKKSHLESVSIFNKVEVHIEAPAVQKQQVDVVGGDKREDGCTGCFKALFKSLKR